MWKMMNISSGVYYLIFIFFWFSLFFVVNGLTNTHTHARRQHMIFNEKWNDWATTLTRPSVCPSDHHHSVLSTVNSIWFSSFFLNLHTLHRQSVHMYNKNTRILSIKCKIMFFKSTFLPLTYCWLPMFG